jgi:short-subunit dehydrogenase
LNKKKKIVIVGATSAIASHCARLWIKNEPIDLVLIGRSSERLMRVANDLRARNIHVNIQQLIANFTDPESIQETVDTVASHGPIEIVLVAHGSLGEQKASEQNLETCKQELEINGVSPVLYAEAFAQVMGKADYGTLAVIGSVAGDRGRKSNYVYGAAKGLLERYIQGMQHRFAGKNFKIVLIKPGPTQTPMTAALSAQGVRMASVETVAMGICAAINRGQRIAYVPGKWFLIMMIIRNLPSFIFNKMNI